MRATALPILIFLAAFSCRGALGVDQTFNITQIAENDPLGDLPGMSCPHCVYGDVWVENGWAYVGTDVNAGGMNIFSYNNAGVPTFVTRYPGDQFEDIEVWNGVGYFGSDVTTSSSGTGVDIVNLADPGDPILMKRYDEVQGGHSKVHTLTVNKMADGRSILYTVDNSPDDNTGDIVKIADVTSCATGSLTNCNPVLLKSLDLGLNPQETNNLGSHEVFVKNERMYVASKDNNFNTNYGWVSIYDVSNPANPTLLKAFKSFTTTPGNTVTMARAHTAIASDDGKTMIVAEERQNGNLYIFDISNVSNPVWKATINRTSVGIDADSPHHPHLHGNLLFVPWYEAGLQVFNISNPANPVRVGSFDTYVGGSTGSYNGNWGVDLSQGLSRVFLSDRSRGLIVVNASGVLLPGDYNQDMVVDYKDYLVWRSTYGTSSSGIHTGAFADGNGNGVVDAADYIVWRTHVGQTGPASGSGASLDGNLTVPEPAAANLIAACIWLVLCCLRLRSGWPRRSFN